MPDRAGTLEVLRDGVIEVVGRVIGSTNNAMLVTLACPGDDPDAAIAAIYKPTAGERPLDDFPDGTLTRREVAAWHVSEASGWDIVPPTILREGPFGEGMVQAFVEPDPSVDVVELVTTGDPRLRRMAVLDAAMNNTDRKGGHILPVDGGGHVHGVDHGVCFSPVPKLRTVLWAWRGQPMADDELEGLRRIRDGLGTDLGTTLRTLLSPTDVRATIVRASLFVNSSCSALSATAMPSPCTSMFDLRLPSTESYFSRWASVAALVRSFTATKSISLLPSAARMMLRPIRPNPLMPTRTAIIPRSRRKGVCEASLAPYRERSPTYLHDGS